MFLSRVELEPSERMKAEMFPHRVHAAIEQTSRGAMRDGDHTRKLWRIDSLNGRAFVLIVSEELPELADMHKQFGIADKKPEIKEYGPFLARIEAGQRWAFRLTANPVKSEFSKDAAGNVSRGKVVALTASGHKPWLLERAEKLGIQIDQESFDTKKDEWRKFKKGGDRKTVSIRAVTFEGVLTVIDADLLREALTKGIGRGKAYGCGLMTLVRDTTGRQ